MASHNHYIKIHDHCTVAPPSATQTSLPLTFFDFFWLRFHPVERIFFYSLHASQSHPSYFFDKVVTKLKTSLSLTLQHFPPLAGKVVWPSDSKNPIIQYTPGDSVSLILAHSHVDFHDMLSDSPHETNMSRSLVPHLESSDSRASAISLQITLFPNRGFSIGISTHHAVLDGKSSTLFIKAWASLCKINDESPSLVPELEPFFDRKVIKNPTDLGMKYSNNLTEMLSKIFPHENSDGRCLKILPFQPRLEDTVRATFVLTREDLEKIKKRVLSKWDVVYGTECSKPTILSSFVLTTAYALVCIAKATNGVHTEKQKFAFGFTVDCRARVEPPIPGNYCGNCVWGVLVDTESLDFIKEEGLVIVAKSIHDKIKMLETKGPFHGSENMLSRYMALAKEGFETIGMAGSNRFGVYGIDFGWGKPAKVEITSVDRALTIGLAESRDGKGGVEVGLVLNNQVMNLFAQLFHQGLHHD
ncbi:hypothetical protein VNO77_21360 [Canavalia gladiata]|uniref:Phenolic glucoside malonyltransferase 1-like n=1 Tax=Canavalia gladiata TaxID=3824 RepID=A0AAN9LRB5_CANGL